MIGLFGTLNMGAHSLEAQQLGTEVVGQNLANVNNPAYARQQLMLQTAPDISTPIGQEGTGVTPVAIQEVRDALLDGQIVSETSTGGSLNAQQHALQDAEASLGEADQLHRHIRHGRRQQPEWPGAKPFQSVQLLSKSFHRPELHVPAPDSGADRAAIDLPVQHRSPRSSPAFAMD